jgi:OmcA/MtrC family decaheme c-type cytochrome
VFSRSNRAFYLDQRQANFIRPGLVVEVTSAAIAADGTISAQFNVTDPKGQPLDRAGIKTPGAIAISFVAATIPNDSGQYVAYTTRVQSSSITGKSAVQATGENNGMFTELGEGRYQYTFRTRAPMNIDRNATHTIGAYASRNLAEFDLGTQYDDDTYDFVPAGGPVTKTRDVIRTATCNGCHTEMAFHGGARRSMELCVTCHSPQSSDPDTGNSLDMTVMTHKIHMGAQLPSVAAGTKYQLIGFGQAVHDYSEVRFPADARNCTACHKQDGAAQANAWLVPTRAACGSCHDDVNFATGEGHVNLPQVSDTQCGRCHTPQGELEFDASIIGAHQIPRLSSSLPGIVFELISITNSAAGSRPTVLFSIKDRSGRPVPASQMTALRLYIAGPTSEYRHFFFEDARTASCDSTGTCSYTFARPVPVDAAGTWSTYVEGYRNATLLEGTARQMTQRDAGQNKTLYFAVDSGRLAPRRTVVSTAKCNACHGQLTAHGEQRNSVEACVVCHNPTQTDVARRPAAQMPAGTIDFKTMIHRIHTGRELQHDYTLFGFGGAAFDFTKVGYPGDRRECNACHVNNSQQLPMTESALPVSDPRGLLNAMGPETAACTSCHSSRAAKAHALANTTPIGESCAACHGLNAQYSVDRVHAR